MQSIETGKILGNYDIDLFQTIIRKIEEAAQKFGDKARYGRKEESDVSFRAIADHARTMTFLIADGVLPGNTDREYVLRRIIRRAARHGRYLGIHRAFLAMAHAGVVEAMGDAYPEIKAAADKTAEVITQEESRFGETLDRGLELIDTELARIKQSGARTIPGEVAFKLYDTYGFPLDLTEDVLRNHAIDVDVAGFNRLMDEQKERGRAARKDDAGAPEISLGAGTASRFVGYHSYEGESEVLAAGGKDGEHVAVVVAETPFYPEGGGQVGDRGVIETASGAILEVSDTRKADGSIVHVGRILRGEAGDFARGARVKLKIDRIRRDAAMLNHSATHILHYALRDILGNTVHQAGSLVDPDKLRFDFAHQGPVKDDALATIEEEINARIRENAEVTTDEMAYDDAIKAGALAFFGDKYGDRVRVVRMGDFSVELCGGTHISRTGDVGVFKLEAESGVAAGVRRIEAVTGQGALETIRKREKILEEIGAQLGARDGAARRAARKTAGARKGAGEKAPRDGAEAGRGWGAGGAEAEEEVREAGGVKDRHAQARRRRSAHDARDGGSDAPEARLCGGRARLRLGRGQGGDAGRGDA